MPLRNKRNNQKPMTDKRIKEKILEILRKFELENTDLEPERTTIVEKAEFSIKIKNEFAAQILALFAQEKQKQLTEILKQIRQIKREFANSPIDKRNGWDWIKKIEEKVNLRG